MQAYQVSDCRADNNPYHAISQQLNPYDLLYILGITG